MKNVEEAENGMIYYRGKLNPKEYISLCTICHGRASCPEKEKDRVMACPDTIMSKYEVLSKEGEAE